MNKGMIIAVIYATFSKAVVKRKPEEIQGPVRYRCSALPIELMLTGGCFSIPKS